MTQFVRDDGGRAESGYRGTTGDCCCRAFAIASGKPYREVYKLLEELGAKERITKKKKKKSHPRTGVYRRTVDKLAALLGFRWVPTMQIGSGCKVHVKAEELPSGRLVLSLSKHYAAFIDGTLYDTYDCSREGTRCVYGYYIKE